MTIHHKAECKSDVLAHDLSTIWHARCFRVVLSACLLISVVVPGKLAFGQDEQFPSQKAENSQAKSENETDVSKKDPRFQELTTAVEQLRVAFEEKSEIDLAEMFDFRRMLDQTLKVKKFDFTLIESQQLETEIERRLPKTLATHADFYAFKRFEIKRIELSEDEQEAVLYVRQWDSDDFTAKMRWWVIRNGSRWQFFDFEDLSISMKFSNLAALGMVVALENPAMLRALQREMLILTQAVQSAINGDFETAKEAISGMDSSILPKSLRAVIHMMNASIAIAEYDPETALAECDLAESLHSDFPVLLYQRAAAHNQLGQYEPARQQAQMFLKKLGGDADATQELAIALQGLDRDDKALKVIREGLDDDPSSAGLLVMLGNALTNDDLHELGDRFEKLPNPSEQFEWICEEFWDNADALEILLAAYRPLAQDDPDVAYYQAQVHLLRDEPAEAAALLKPVLPKVMESEEYEYYQELYQEALLADGRWRELYSGANDKSEVFALIADHFFYREDFGPLKQLIELYGEQNPNDSQLHIYIGQLATREEDWPRAIEAYRKAMQLEPEEGWHYRVVEAMFEGGRALEALKTVEPTEEVFAQLMSLAEQQETLPVDLMESLIQEYLDREPEGVAGLFWQAKLAYSQNHYSRAVNLLQQHTAAIKSEEDFAWQFGPLLVNSLVHLKKYDDAESEAFRVYQEHEDPFPAAVVAAAQGDVEKTEHWLKKYVDEYYYSPNVFYEDEILGPALRSDAFETLRQEYPPPEDETSAPEDQTP